jgi:class 3 adenylate cyclase
MGSTVLGERLDPEELRLVVGDAVARIVAEVERLGGRVNDLAGDGVLAFFGAPVTSEDDPERDPDPEYYLRLLLHSRSKTNEGGFSCAPLDQLIERARREGDGRARLELFHEADRLAVADQVALVPIYYARGLAYVQPWVAGWWESGHPCPSLANLTVADRTQY